MGHLQPADFCGFEASVPLSHAIGLGQRDTSHSERDTAWDSSGTVDIESGLPKAWIEGYQQLITMRRPRADPLGEATGRTRLEHR